ncbi:MAG TPA: hypothetical protein VNP95_01940 [Thermomicrobiales bacterium]|nr:hypothetical protein [Thermomicrobiales bacterium]
MEERFDHELQFLRYVLERNEATAAKNGTWVSSRHDFITAEEVSNALGFSVEEVTVIRARCEHRGWITPRGTLGDPSRFTATLTPYGIDEAEQRAARVSIQGPVSIALASVDTLGLDVDGAAALRQLVNVIGSAAPKESRVAAARSALGILSDAATIGDGLVRFLPLLAAIVAQIH